MSLFILICSLFLCKANVVQSSKAGTGGGNGFSKSDSVVVSIEDGVEFSHENVSDQEHFLGDVHGHNCGSTSVSTLGSVFANLILLN